jgi:hypothetical protein
MVPILRLRGSVPQGHEQAHAVGVVVQLADVGAFSELAGSQGQQDGPADREVVTEPFG